MKSKNFNPEEKHFNEMLKRFFSILLLH